MKRLIKNIESNKQKELPEWPEDDTTANHKGDEKNKYCQKMVTWDSDNSTWSCNANRLPNRFPSV